MIYILGGRVITMEGDIWDKGYICIDRGKIKELGPMKNGAPFPLLPEENVEIINALGCVIMPGLIEAHCHMGITEEKVAEIVEEAAETVDKTE